MPIFPYIPDGAKLIRGLLNFLSRWQAAPAVLLPHAPIIRVFTVLGLRVHDQDSSGASKSRVDRAVSTKGGI
jgi:hypothetical protein